MAKNKGPKTPEVVLISDPNSDVDDLLSFVTAAALADRGLLKLKGVIATTGNPLIRLRRARFCKGAFIKLGYPFLAVSVGGEYELYDEKHDNFYGETPAVIEVEKLGMNVRRNPMEILQSAVQQAEEKSLVIVINAQMRDVAVFFRNCSAKQLQKIKKVVIMGGIKAERDNRGFALPDEKSYNNAVCMSAATELYAFLQEQNIPLLLVPKESVYQAQLGRDFYEKIAEINGMLAKCICESNKSFLECLWNSVKAGDYSHFDIRRFAKVFMGEEYKISSRELSGRDDFAKVWEKIRYFNLYDPMAVIAAVDSLFKTYGHYERICETARVFEAKIDDADGLRQLFKDLIFSKIDVRVKLNLK